MALDHYVSQVHLRKFYSPKLQGLMFAIRKSDLKSFRCNSQSVCRIEDGSSNRYLQKYRVIEEFLRYVEPNYSDSLTKAYKNHFDQESILSIAGFVASVLACSPAGMRIFSDPLKASVETHAAILDRSGEIPPAPDMLGGKSLSELLKDGILDVNVDPKFPQALGIASIVGWVSVFGNSRWEILLNELSDSPFFTSDFPVGLERSQDPRVLNRIVPLAPDLAIRICPDIRLSGSRPDLSFKGFSSKLCTLRRQEVVDINRRLVRCAEDTIFYRDDLDWIAPFVTKNRYYRAEGTTQSIPHGRGFLNVSTQCIVLAPKVRYEPSPSVAANITDLRR
jgi:hypothetical protein